MYIREKKNLTRRPAQRSEDEGDEEEEGSIQTKSTAHPKT